MRIIAGAARRVQLEVADASPTRPFLEMARGALFNSLGEACVGAEVLDLFAGSGALGLEALSRGAARCLFVERDARALAALRRNIVKCGMADRARTERCDAKQALRETDERFDLLFIDPPFPDLPEWRADGGCGGLMRDAARVLREDGVLVFRLEEGKATAPEWPDLALVSDRRYGRSRICRYRRRDGGGTTGEDGA